MDIHFIIALLVFFGSLILFFFEKIDKTLVSLGSIIILIITGVLTPIEAAKSIDKETLLLLFGLMLVVGVATASGFFSYLNMKIAKISAGDPKKVFLLFIILMTLASTVLNNATLTLLIVPIAIAIARGLSLDSKLLVILLAIFSNIGGTLTLIGDPPNTLIGVQAKLPFMDFIYNLWVPILSMTIVIIVYTMYVYKSSFPKIKNDLTKTFTSSMIIERISYNYFNKKMNLYVASIAIIFVFLTVLLLIFQPNISEITGVEEGMIAFIGLAVGIISSILVMTKVKFHTIMKEVEWDSMLFFAGLFVQVGALEKVGFLKSITQQVVQFSDNLPLLILVIIWGIGLASTIINNIPFVAMMIPIIMDLQTKMSGTPHVDLLWWALALGACLGGNGTIIGSASGVIACDLAKKQGVNISFMDFFKVGMPITIISLIISSLYLMGVFYFT